MPCAQSRSETDNRIVGLPYSLWRRATVTVNIARRPRLASAGASLIGLCDSDDGGRASLGPFMFFRSPSRLRLGARAKNSDLICRALLYVHARRVTLKLYLSLKRHRLPFIVFAFRLRAFPFVRSVLFGGWGTFVLSAPPVFFFRRNPLFNI